MTRMQGMSPSQELHPEDGSTLADQLNGYADQLRAAATVADGLACNLRNVDPDDTLGINAALDPHFLIAEAISLVARTGRMSKASAERIASLSISAGNISIKKAARLLGQSVNTLRRRLPSKAAAQTTSSDPDIF